MDDELQKLRKQIEELTELYNMQSHRATDYAGAFMRSKREWVGLTDEEIWGEGSSLPLSKEGIVAFVRSIESNLKEKNT